MRHDQAVPMYQDSTWLGGLGKSRLYTFHCRLSNFSTSAGTPVGHEGDAPKSGLVQKNSASAVRTCATVRSASSLVRRQRTCSSLHLSHWRTSSFPCKILQLEPEAVDGPRSSTWQVPAHILCLTHKWHGCRQPCTAVFVEMWNNIMI